MKQLFAIIVILLASAGYWHFKDWHTYPPIGNHCFDQLVENLESAHLNTSITVPEFAADHVTMIHCSTVPGFMAFELAGTDTAGRGFHLYETVGGKAASGADSVFDYCYMRDTMMVSGTRITGRAGKVSEPICSYRPYYTEEEDDKYEYNK